MDDNHSYEVKISEKLFDDLDMSFLGKMGSKDILEKYLTCNPDIIKERHLIFKELSSKREFADFIDDVLLKTESLISLLKEGKKYTLRESGNNERKFTSFRELLFFTECIDTLSEGAKSFKNNVSSKFFSDIFDYSESVAESLWYKNAKLYIEKTADEIKNIKSLSLGVNLNAQLGVKEFGIISFNSDYYRTNSIFDKLFAKNIANKDYVCIAPVCGDAGSFSGYSIDVFNNALYRAISSVAGDSISKIRKNFFDIFCDNTSFLISRYDDIKFICLSYRYIVSMEACGLPVCFPEISEEYSVSGIYNPNFAGDIESKRIVKNDVTFDNNGKIYILTGANSGGKTAFLRSVGIAQVLFQLGLPVPAKNAKMQIFTNIFSHFASKIKDIQGGRFENECRNIMDFYNDISSDTLLLLDEMFSTTSSFEGGIISAHVLKKLALSGCKCIYTTHLHELAYKADEINASADIKSRIDNLSAQVTDGICTYKILRKRDNYGSLADAICKKYGFLT